MHIDWLQQPALADGLPALPPTEAPRTLREANGIGDAPERRLKTRAYDRLKDGFAAIEAFSRSQDRFLFDSRQSGAPLLVCMLAGYKPDLWPIVIPRFKQALPGADICIVSPGLKSEPLAALCRKEGWSYLSTATNDVALAQNVCYRLHESANMIVKLDEDMFLLPDTVTNLLAEYSNIKAAGIVDPGFVAPMIPLNGFCYRHLLELLGLLEEYEAKFGIARLATAGLPVHTDAAAARWMWERTVPLAATAGRLRSMEIRHLPCPIQFSIGLIAFERRFWEMIGYLKVSWRRILTGISTLGGDEAYLCARALELSRPGVVTTAAFAGHFSFGPQYQRQKDLLRHRPEIFQE